MFKKSKFFISYGFYICDRKRKRPDAKKRPAFSQSKIQQRESNCLQLPLERQLLRHLELHPEFLGLGPEEYPLP